MFCFPLPPSILINTWDENPPELKELGQNLGFFRDFRLGTSMSKSGWKKGKQVVWGELVWGVMRLFGMLFWVGYVIPLFGVICGGMKSYPLGCLGNYEIAL